MPDTLYILDVSSLMYQVFHAIAPMTGPAGQPTNAIFGFTRDILTILRDCKPTHLLCALDSSGPGLRNEIFPEYKANRAETPDDLKPQIPAILRIIEGFRIPALQLAGWEADDVIATVARQAVEEGLSVRLVTNDKDARQLLGPHVQMFNIRKNVYLDEAGLLADWGIRPDQVVDYQSLVGDSVDNVPGVPLVGPKKAAALLTQFGTLDEVLAHADQAPGKKLRENLRTFAEQARISRKLVQLNAHLPIEVNLQRARIEEPDAEFLLQLFQEFGFRRFGEEVRQLAPSAKVAEADSSEKQKRSWTTIDTPEAFAEFLRELRAQKCFAVDLETTSLDAVRADIVGWAICWQAGSGYYIPVQGPPGQKVLDAGRVLAELKPLLEDPQREICNQNIKYDMLVLSRAGVNLQAVGLDPMVGSYLLDAGARSHGLDALAERYLNHRMIPIKDLIGSGKTQKKMFDVDVHDVAEYASEDADIAWQLCEIITRDLKQENLWDLYWELERRLIPVLVDLESTGIRVDPDELQRQSALAEVRLAQLCNEIYQLAGREFNIASPIQLRQILFEELKLPIIKKTRTGASTDQEVLETLADQHELPARIIEHRQLAKLKGTYLDALPRMINPETGRIHASFNQVVAATGRLSSSDPNLQNIPIRTPEGRQIRRAFIPGEAEWKFVCADYSQIELRMLAHFSGDPALVAAFRAGEDIHTLVAAEVFGVDPEQVDSSMRRVAKAVNFGVIYGQSPYGLAATLKISQDEAARFIDGYFKRFADVERYLEHVLQECAETGYARTIRGRRRAIEGIRHVHGRQRNMPERTAINTVIQGSAADLIKIAMIRVHDRLARENHPAHMLLQIHDELVFEAPVGETASLIEIVRDEMEQALSLDVPLVVDVSTGDNWLEVEGQEQPG